MKINTKVRYGLKALAYIAENSSDKKLVRIKEISEDQDISIQYLEQILFKLKNENIIEGKRGPTGGYKLTLKPNQINLYTIYKILDDEERVIDCNENAEGKAHNCNENAEGKAHNCTEEACGETCIWSRLDNAMTKILSETSLEDFIKNGKKI